MPARDIYHNNVKNALIKDGWAITHDPYTLTFGQKDVFVDLGAEKILAAEKGHEKIASVFISTLNEPIARPVIEDLAISLIAFDPKREVIVKWTT